MRPTVSYAASLAALATAAAATVLSTAALAHPGLPGHTHDADGAVVYSLSGVNDMLVILAVGALAAALTVWALLRRRSHSA
jgi:hydrogenase/urease accessory protein HupE